MAYFGLDRLLRRPDRQAPSSDAGTQVQTITIYDEDCQVTAHKTGVAIWKAYGYVKGTPIQVTDDNAAAAFNRWRNLARNSVGRQSAVSSFRD